MVKKKKGSSGSRGFSRKNKKRHKPSSAAGSEHNLNVLCEQDTIDLSMTMKISKPRLNPWPSRHAVSVEMLKTRLNPYQIEQEEPEKASCSTRHPKYFSLNDRKQWHKTDKSNTRKRKRKEADHCQVLVKEEMQAKTKPSVQTTNKHDKEQDIEIPGFYFDKEKKKYFKILPNANNGAFINQKVVQEKKAEEKRQMLLNKLLFDSNRICKIKHRLSLSHSQSQFKGYLLNSISERSCGIMNFARYNRVILHNKVSSLMPRCKSKIFQIPRGSYEQLEHMYFMQPTLDGSKYLCLWSLKALMSQRIQHISVNCKSESDENKVYMSLEPHHPIIQSSLSKVTSMCWAPTSPTDVSSRYLLYTTVCYFGSNPGANCAILRKLDSSLPDEFENSVFSIGSKATWACAWNPHIHKFSVGTESCGLLLDVETRRLWELFTEKSDVLSQKFSQDGLLLYSGTRKGRIFLHDMRSKSTRFIASMQHRSSVCWLHLLTDSNYILASDFSGKIRQWDLRTRRIVQEYVGHSNQHKSLPFSVDERNQLLCAVGQDCYSRIWDLREAKLLHTIPSPFPASIDEIPSVCLTDNIHGYQGVPSLLMGIRDQIHLYTM